MKHTSRAIVLCDCRKCRRWIRDAETLRLIVKHRMDIHYSLYNKPRGWYASPVGVSKFVPGKSIHTAVLKAAKGAP